MVTHTRSRLARLTVVVAVLASAGAPSALAVSMGATDPPDPVPARQEMNATAVDPGGYAAAVIGSRGASIDAAIRRDRLGTALAGARTDRETAAVVAESLERARARLSALEARHEALVAARENGSLAAGAYRDRAVPIASAAATLDRHSARLAGAAEPVPRIVRREHGITRAAIVAFGDRVRALAAATPDPLPAGRGHAGLYEDLPRWVDRYNAAVDRPTGFALAGQLAGERVELAVRRADGGRSVVSFRLVEDGQIAELRAGGRDDATLRMRTDRTTVGRMANAGDPAAALRDAIRDDRVEVVGVGLVDRIKWAVVDAGLELL